MPKDPRLAKLADVLARYSVEVKPGDVCGISYDVGGMPLVDELVRAVVQAGGHPFLMPRRTLIAETLLTHGSDEQLSFNNPMVRHYVETVNVHVTIWAEENTKALSRMPAHKLALFQQGARTYMKIMMERAALPKDDPRHLRGCGTQMPTTALAQDAEMSLSQYEDFVFAAGLLHEADPVAAWKRVSERQEVVRGYLQGKRELRFVAPACDGHDGTDLRVDVSKATWINCCGTGNFPDGEVFAGPTLPSMGGFGASGHVNYTFPAVYNGREVEGVRLQFEGGRVVKASAGKGEDYLRQMLDQDAGARNLGEIAIGTNYGISSFSKNTLFDEKIGGTFHAAVGAGYPESGSTNESGLHWDMVCDLRPRTSKQGPVAGGRIYADGELFHEDGKFLVKGW
jgi:aminopeptidase